MMKANREGAARELSPAMEYRSGMVFKLAEQDTTAALERQLGLSVVDDERLAQLGLLQATQVMHNAVDPQSAPAAEVNEMTQAAPEGDFQPLPGFGTDEAMPPVVGDKGYDLAA
jgi:hypothetical protein